MFNILKTISVSTLTAVALTGAVATPTFANDHSGHQVEYHDTHHNNNDQVAGGAVGAILGGLVGSQVAGHGHSTEGAVIGALAGGAAGVAVTSNGHDGHHADRRAYHEYNGGI